MKVTSESAFDDLRSIVAMHDDYCSVEPFIDWDYDLRSPCLLACCVFSL